MRSLLVLLKIESKGEPLATVFTLKRFIRRMRLLMNAQVTGVGEALRTEATLKGLLPSVDSHMTGQEELPGDGCSTLGAFEPSPGTPRGTLEAALGADASGVCGAAAGTTGLKKFICCWAYHCARSKLKFIASKCAYWSILTEVMLVAAVSQATYASRFQKQCEACQDPAPKSPCQTAFNYPSFGEIRQKKTEK
uniref:Secreted protein n=1 Tax=Steinernema glaseri TaxID=37863 RepID=A0A1I8AL55_9BILA